MDALLDFAPLLGIPAVVKILDAYRLLVQKGDVKGTALTVGAWLVGFGVIALVGQSSSAGDFANLNLADMVLLGIGLGSTASVVHDATKPTNTEVVVAGHEATPPSVIINTGGETIEVTDGSGA